jgi:hypothetical protein
MEQSENIQHKKFVSVNIVSTYCIYCPGWGGGGVQCWVDLKYIKTFPCKCKIYQSNLWDG